MAWWSEYAARIEPGAPLEKLTWFKLGGPARWLFRPGGVDDLAAVARRARDEQVPVRVLGAGANVLVRDDGVDGMVVRLEGPVFRGESIDGERVIVGGGVDVMPLARRLASAGLAGLEFMAGIPATVGGAIRMNAGGLGGEFGDVVRRAVVMMPDGTVEDWDRPRLAFGYRSSAIRDEIVLSAELELHPDDPAEIRKRYDAFFAAKRASQPLAEKSAGCIFKNPPGQSAGALIDRAGLKGARRGKASVSHRHANFIVADRDAKASDVLGLMDMIKQRVLDRWGMTLQEEIEVW
jgi:UDP-N-acetylmuramate dehydrogenase